MDLKGKVALVNGGSRGIGASIAKVLAKNGANVAFTFNKSQEASDLLVEEIKKEFELQAIAIKTNAVNYDDVSNAVNTVIEKFGKLDILVNNAGINKDKVIWKMEESQWDDVIATNLKGYFHFIKAVAPIFKNNNYGKIINISSINGIRGKFGQSNYSASKAGIIGLSKSVARELGRFNVNVNVVAPGLIETDMVKNAPDDVKNKAMAEIVLGRIGKPEEVANVVAFLASEEARHISGEVIKVDGGQYI